MLSSAARKQTSLTETQQITRDAGALVSRKIWLPRLLLLKLKLQLCLELLLLLLLLQLLQPELKLLNIPRIIRV